MNNFFSVDYRMSKGNMHVDLEGCFDTSAAKQFITFLSSFYRGEGRVFVDTAKLSLVTEHGAGYFKESFSHASVFAGNLYLKGQRGFSLLPQGGRVILMKSEVASEKKHVCSGNCKECKCGHRKKTS